MELESEWKDLWCSRKEFTGDCRILDVFDGMGDAGFALDVLRPNDDVPSARLGVKSTPGKKRKDGR